MAQKPNQPPATTGHEVSDPLMPLVGQLRALIADARQRVLRAVDVIQVQTCWQVGRHIVEGS